jgi:hypothetical protein
MACSTARTVANTVIGGGVETVHVSAAASNASRHRRTGILRAPASTLVARGFGGGLFGWATSTTVEAAVSKIVSGGGTVIGTRQSSGRRLVPVRRATFSGV